MKQVLIRQGRVVVEELPVPACGPHQVLVRTAYSLISSGTERANLQASAPTARVARWGNRLKKAGDVLQLARARGLRETGQAVRARLDGPSLVSGYSLSGTVLRVGTRVGDLVPGQPVACAGAESAFHAEMVAVPRNLVVPVPAGLALKEAACVTLGAIALQGVRQADARLGEVACVVGLGLVGQLAAALLHTAGCRVIGADLDAQRVERAQALGIELAVNSASEDLETVVDQRTAGRGADAVLLAATTASSEPLRQAVRMLRRRGRVVVLGAVGMDVERSEFYAKEAELRISRSYGPGRHDSSYEEDGHDYPYEYVRWTENRNMSEFLRLAAEGRLPVRQLLDRCFAIEDAPAAYAALSGQAGATRPLGVLLEYPQAESTAPESAGAQRVSVVGSGIAARGLGVALVGPGEFAHAVHLPNLARLAPQASLRAVVGRSGNRAREAGRRFAAAYATTELDEALRDSAVAVVIVCTRHDQHAEQAARALRAGKAVYLEKPAALSEAELDLLERAVLEAARPFTVGFNRRCAPAVVALRSLLEKRGSPLVLQYRVNAERLPTEHWVHGAQGGGRLIGEACHMIDLLGHLVGAPRTSHALALLHPPGDRADLRRGDNFTLSCRYADGSVAALTYTSLGHADAGKERLECHWDGRSAILDDFRTLRVIGIEGADHAGDAADKGHRELLRRFLDHVASGGSEPIPLREILDVSRFVLQLDREARGPCGP